MARFTDAEIKAAMRVQAITFVDAHFSSIGESVLTLAKAQPGGMGAIMADALFDALVEKIVEMKAQVAAKLGRPAKLADVDRNASRWPGGHTHDPETDCRAVEGCPARKAP